MITYSKGVKKNDHGLVTVALFKCWRPFGKSYWYCRFGVAEDLYGPLTFYHGEHTNKFTAYYTARNAAITRNKKYT